MKFMNIIGYIEMPYVIVKEMYKELVKVHRCRYADCPNGNVIAKKDKDVNCHICRKEMGL